MKVKHIYRKEYPTLFWISLVGGLGLAASALLLVTSAWLISAASTRPAILELEVAIVLVRLFGISRGALRYAARILEHDQIFKITSQVRVVIYRSLVRQGKKVSTIVTSNTYLAQINNSIDFFNDRWLRINLPITNLAVLTSVIWFFYYFFCKQILLIVIPLTCFLFVGLLIGIKREQRNELIKESLLQNRIDLTSQMQAAITSLSEGAIFGYTTKIKTEIDEIQQNVLKLEAQRAKRESYWQISVNIAFLFLAIPITLFTIDHYLRGQISGFLVAPFILAPLALFEPIYLLPAALSLNQQGWEAKDNLDFLLVEDGELQDNFTKEIAVNHGVSSFELINFQPHIPTKELLNFNLELRPNQIALIEGASGSGKSSLIEALIGNLKYSGKALVDGIELTNEDLADFSILLQRDHLFLTSIRENFRIANQSIADDEIWDLLSLVNLDQVVASRSEGLDLVLSDLTTPFSGGEIQRLKWARSIARKSSIVIWDEPCEFLDANLIKEILPKVINYLFAPGNTSLAIISHIDLRPALSGFTII